MKALSWSLIYNRKGENISNIFITLPKNKDQLTWTYAGYSEKAVSGKGFFYSDYLKLILFTKLTGNNEYAVYARIADVIQQKQI